VTRRLVVCMDSLCAMRAAAAGRAPSLLQAAALLEVAGVSAVQLGLAEELQPVTEADVRSVAGATAVELRISPAPNLVKVALEMRPARVVLASESRESPVLASPLDFRAWGAALAPAVRNLRDAGLRVDALVAPVLDAVKTAHAADLQGVDFYTAATLDLPPGPRAEALTTLGDAARLGAKLRLSVGISGALGARELPLVLEAAPVLDRVTVGRAFVNRALLVGIERASADLRGSI
jgi:pyridoxine 5'-phosphate synthase PdxJ